jgi:DNA-binding MarR family transcriptional regulator
MAEIKYLILEIPTCYVQNMNNNKPVHLGAESYKALQILDELSMSGSMTQRDISQRLGIALGLVNSYIKNLVAKGYVTVKTIPVKRYTYYLTPKGFAEKTRLAYALLHDYTRIYREARTNLKALFRELSDSGIKKIVFAGTDEASEIAYITLQETDIELVGVVDIGAEGKTFFGNDIKPVGSIRKMKYDLVIVTSYIERKNIFEELLTHGVNKKFIKLIFPL